MHARAFLFLCLCKCAKPALSFVPVTRHILYSLCDPRRNFHDQSKGALRQITRGRQEQRGTFPSNPTVCLCQKLDVLTEETLHISPLCKRYFLSWTEQWHSSISFRMTFKNPCLERVLRSTTELIRGRPGQCRMCFRSSHLVLVLTVNHLSEEPRGRGKFTGNALRNRPPSKQRSHQSPVNNHGILRNLFVEKMAQWMKEAPPLSCPVAPRRDAITKCSSAWL